MSKRSLFDLTDRVAVVTGAGAGIGAAIAVGLAEAGAHVVAGDINLGAVEQTAAQVAATGRRGLGLRCDVTRPDDIERLFAAADEHFGRLDILVNNVGIPSHSRPEDLGLAEWERVLQTNLTGYFLCAQAAGRRMLPQGRGSIINISSIAGISALGRGNLAYSVSKGAINQFTRELAVEWAKHGVRVNALLPVQIRTAALQALVDDPQFDSDTLIKSFLRGIPLNRLGETDDLVGPAVFLASDAAAMVTGTLLPVDGGNLALNSGGNHTW